jgi:hypothetical protein
MRKSERGRLVSWKGEALNLLYVAVTRAREILILPGVLRRHRGASEHCTDRDPPPVDIRWLGHKDTLGHNVTLCRRRGGST